MKTAVVLVLASVLLPACTQRVTDFTLLSTKNVDLSRMGEYRRGARQVGENSSPIILWIPIGSPSYKEAIDRAIESVPGAVALVDGVVYYRVLWFILGGEQRVFVEGNVLIDPKAADLLKVGSYKLKKDEKQP